MRFNKTGVNFHLLKGMVDSEYQDPEVKFMFEWN